jgi:ferric iron reductase protein FhuF
MKPLKLAEEYGLTVADSAFDPEYSLAGMREKFVMGKILNQFQEMTGLERKADAVMLISKRMTSYLISSLALFFYSKTLNTINPSKIYFSLSGKGVCDFTVESSGWQEADYSEKELKNYIEALADIYQPIFTALSSLSAVKEKALWSFFVHNLRYFFTYFDTELRDKELISHLNYISQRFLESIGESKLKALPFPVLYDFKEYQPVDGSHPWLIRKYCCKSYLVSEKGNYCGTCPLDHKC